MRTERLDCALASPDLVAPLRLVAGHERGLSALPIVATTPTPSVSTATTIEAQSTWPVRCLAS